MSNIDLKHLSGRLNSDDSNEVMLPTDSKMAMNGRYRGTVPNLRFEGVEGNVIIPNNQLPAGNNECLGSFYDGQKQRLFWMNWNSLGRNGIYLYDLVTKTISSLLICFTDSQTDILGFDLDFPIPSINIIYTTDEDGDLYCWTDRNKRPKILNIKSALDKLYGSNWLEEYLDVAKAPPSLPIKCAYENDDTATVNNLRKQLFIPKYRFIYGDNLKTVWSAWGNLPVPFKYTIPQIDTDPTKNCRIRTVVQTGSADVKKIEIAFNELGSDFFSVVILDKAALSIPDNDVYIYDFYNNEQYATIDPKESLLTFDYVPDKANCQELLNGNVIVYGGILEGKDPVTTAAIVSPHNDEIPLTQNTSSILSVTQHGLQGFGSANIINPIKFIVLGNVRFKDVYSAQILVGSTMYTVTYTAALNDTPALVLAGLSASAGGQGFVQISITATTLVIGQTSQILQKSNLLGVNQTITATFAINNSTKIINYNGGATAIGLFFKGVQFSVGALNSTILTVVSSMVSGSDLLITYTGEVVTQIASLTTLQFDPLINQSIPAYDPSSKLNFALVYFDEKGKTDGVLTAISFNAATPPYGITINFNYVGYNIPYFNFSITSRPPIWAKYYHIVRTNNLSKSNFLYWMSDRTFKDDKYAYISVETIQSYKKRNPTSIISYDFATGDRIKFYMLFNADGLPATTYGNEHDYEIIGQVVNPDINGVTRNGQFLKLNLPTTTSIFDFSNGVSKQFDYYLIDLYTPAKSAGKLDEYFEFSQEYLIINPGTSNCCHQGQLQNQTSDLVTPATFKMDNGDAWFRKREINIGDSISYDLVAGLVEPGFILGQTLTNQILPNPDYHVATSVAYQQFITFGGAYNAPGWTINDITSTYTFRVQGIINGTCAAATTGTFRIRIGVVDSANSLIYYTLGQNSAPVVVGEQITFNVDTYIVFPPNSKSFLIMDDSPGSGFVMNLISGNLNYSEPSKTFNIGVFDPNFSDFFISKINANGRVHVVNPDEKTIKFQTILRWGLAYQQNTNINQINRFYGGNFDEVDRAKGEIQWMWAYARQLIVMQNRAVGQYGVYSKFLQSNTGNVVTTTDEILTKNNISYYLGEYGCGEQYCQMIKAKHSFYFKDPVRGYDVRWANDGLEPISEQNKGQFFIQPLFPPYNKPYLRTNGSKAKILGAYNFAEEEAVNVLQGGTLNGSTILPYTFSWNEKRNSYCSFFNFIDRDWIANGEEFIFTWKNGQLYIHNNTAQPANFDGVQYYPSITLAFNDKVGIRKTFNALSIQSNKKWVAEILTSEFNEQTGLQQMSSLNDGKDWEPRGNYFDAALLRDKNSMVDARLALLEGDFLEGQWIEIKLTYVGNKPVYLYMPYIEWQLNNRNF